MPTDTDRTQLIARPAWENPRVHLLDDIWLLTIVAILVATGLPWLASGFEVDLAPATWGLLALGAVHAAFAGLPSLWDSQDWWRTHGLILLEVAGVIIIGFIWQHVGGLQNPMFLTVFALPVFGATFISRWHPYLIAAVGVFVVAVVSLGQDPELRWYASGLLGSDRWLAWLFGPQRSEIQHPFGGFYAPSNYLIVLLEVFATGLFACAVAAEYVGAVFERLNAHTLMARREAERGEELWVNLIERLPLPALLIDPVALRIVAASELAGASLQGRYIFDVLQFSYPDVVRELITGSDGELPSSVVRVAGSPRIIITRVMHFAHKGRRLALVTLDDRTESYCLRAALDTSEYASLVIDGQGRVLTFNRHAVGLFGRTEVGMAAAELLRQPHTELRWWEPGLTGRRKMHMEIGPRLYQVTSSTVTLAGEDERVFTVSFLPMARSGAETSSGTGLTSITNIMEKLQ